ncbi:MAG: 1-acyl-sn-glycerol-3-phosphate acyltransferase [Eubacteriaceae bacterium]|nr:1-acyl-sn-glycerol-3-phosphate acyltransferase [Eubacteriaceae bacterium]
MTADIPRKFLYHTLKTLFGWAICLLYGFSYKKYKPEAENFIMISNHLTDVDFLCMVKSFPNHFYYVASDAIGRNSFLHNLLTLLVNPIWRKKTTNDLTTVYQILKRTKAGESVCIFAEGGRSMDGRTLPVAASTGKLIKAAGVALITYKIKGGYFIQPRWAKKFRRGKFSGEVIGEYSAEQIKNMSAQQVQSIIEEDIFEDAYATQREVMAKYTGKNIAESIEVALYLCPECKGLSTLHSKGDKFTCESCGRVFKYDEYGFIESADGGVNHYDNLADWYRWEKEEIRSRKDEYLSYEETRPITTDKKQHLTILDNRSRRGDRHIYGDVTAYRDRMEFLSEEGQILSFDYNNFSDTDVLNRQSLIFTIKGGASYILNSDVTYTSPFKYIELICMLRTDGRNSRSG